jgi:hypothetical protein
MNQFSHQVLVVSGFLVWYNKNAFFLLSVKIAKIKKTHSVFMICVVTMQRGRFEISFNVEAAHNQGQKNKNTYNSGRNGGWGIASSACEGRCARRRPRHHIERVPGSDRIKKNRQKKGHL